MPSDPVGRRLPSSTRAIPGYSGRLRSESLTPPIGRLTLSLQGTKFLEFGGAANPTYEARSALEEPFQTATNCSLTLWNSRLRSTGNLAHKCQPARHLRTLKISSDDAGLQLISEHVRVAGRTVDRSRLVLQELSDSFSLGKLLASDILGPHMQVRGKPGEGQLPGIEDAMKHADFMLLFHGSAKNLIAVVIVATCAAISAIWGVHHFFNVPDEAASRKQSALSYSSITSNDLNGHFSPRGFTEFVHRVLRPTISLPLLPSSTSRSVQAAIEMLQPDRDGNLSDLVHYLYLTGPNARVSLGFTENAPLILDLLLDSDRGVGHFGSRALCETRYGGQFVLFDSLMMGTKQPGAEAHRSQVLSVLATLGIEVTHPISFQSGVTSSVQSLLDHVVANFFLDGEIYWEAVLLSLYVPPGRGWTNRFGEFFTFDQLAKELLDRDLGDSSCAGTHRLIALTILMRVDREIPLLSQPIRVSVCKHLQAVAAILTRSQVDGSWQQDWYQEMGKSPTLESRQASIADRVVATGHHLEWLMLLPQEIQPPREVFATASRFLSSNVPGLCKDKDWTKEWYCPATHGLRCLVLLHSELSSVTTDDRAEIATQK